jgi:hypothetical protein
LQILKIVVTSETKNNPMTETIAKPNQPDWTKEPGKLPDMLNVLTILSFIGCGLAFVFGFTGFINAKSTYDKVIQMQDKIDQMPGYLKGMMGPDPVGMAQKTLDNRLPIFLLTLVSASLCLYGAIQMRKLKKAGFGIYVVGEILPMVTTFIFLGTMSQFALYFSIFLIALFVILYATQLKYMK